MAINSTGKCDSCANNEPSDICQEIGQSVHINGGREGDTDHAFLQCTACGSVWLRIRDSGGLGGHGTFYHLLTGNFY